MPSDLSPPDNLRRFWNSPNSGAWVLEWRRSLPQVTAEQALHGDCDSALVRIDARLQDQHPGLEAESSSWKPAV